MGVCRPPEALEGHDSRLGGMTAYIDNVSVR
jgi:hypothetical protein